ncbi:uncharacterized protein LOC119293504 [Triticum dicoccoides]|uniref:uncharacterized protein LOC119293504 n=1 Tax=Triticum dicoccoides TaxID=85692 RepID=UPI00188E1961|nr:uncharacterized protein LOC119293504 [Triticum dicoccoides]
MADAGGERPDWGADLVEKARQVAAGTFVRGRAGVQRGAPSAADLEKAGAGCNGAVQPDAPALAISGEAQKVEAGSGEAQKVEAGSGEAHEVEKVDKVEAGSGEEQAEQKLKEDLVGNKRKWDASGYDPYDSDEDEPYEYESGDDVVQGNAKSFEEKEELKIRAQGPAKYYNWRSDKYRCPYCSRPKPRSGLLEHLMEHCRATSISSHDYKIRAQHSALHKVLKP